MIDNTKLDHNDLKYWIYSIKYGIGIFPGTPLTPCYKRQYFMQLATQ